MKSVIGLGRLSLCVVWVCLLASCGGDDGLDPAVVDGGGTVTGPEDDGLVTSDGIDDPSEADTAVDPEVSEKVPSLSDIQDTVFKNSCNFSSCHGSAASPQNGNLDLQPEVAYDNLVGVESSYPGAKEEGLLLVAPGAPDDSFLMIKLELTEMHPEYGQQMPPLVDSQIPAESLQMVRDWIAAGAPAP